MKKFITVLPLLMLFFLAACSSTAKKPSEKSVSKGADVKAQISQAYQAYKGTPYQFGGLSKKGLDCSGFIYLSFRDYLNTELPRTTELQAKAGKKLSKKALKTGDIVLFKTGKKQLHSGIYLDDQDGGRFVHASTSKGVIISYMKNVYWKERFWQGRRL